jgi:DNA-binding transcriptional ArsR family regulator
MCTTATAQARKGAIVNTQQETEILQLHAQICAGLADPKRIMLLYELAAGARNVTELAAALDMPQPLVSRHLKVLRERGMVIAERVGPAVRYHLADERLIRALDLLREALRDILAKRLLLMEAIG